MSIETIILLVGVLFLGGWLWAYMFIRQLLFNGRVAMPLIRRMRAEQEDLIAIGAVRYTTISTVVCSVISVLLLAVVVFLCRKHWYFLAAFGVGALIASIMLLRMVKPDNRSMFSSFCAGYYRFIPDDELRTAFYNQKTGPIRTRLREMGFSGEIVPKMAK